MKQSVVLCILLSGALYDTVSMAQQEPFQMTVLNQRPPSAQRYRLGHPFEIVYGPDNKLYITEKVGRILQVDTGTGLRTVLLDIRSQVRLAITRNSSGEATGIGQDGMMGMDLHPDFNKGMGKDSVYVAYRHNSTGTVRIVRYRYNATPTPSLSNPLVLIDGIPASNDHSSGRLIIGADYKIYYSCGDLGYNQFSNRCNEIRSQFLPTAAQISSSNYVNYSGKILRINLDGSIPSDNPLFDGVRSHIYTIGHRNPQGLVWEKMPGNGTVYPVLNPAGNLYSSEHGPRTDDEINILYSGRNYGWPFVSGHLDDLNYSYVNWSSSGTNCNVTYSENTIPTGATVLQESAAPASVIANLQEPMMSLYESCGTQTTATCNAQGTDWMRFPTIAPSSIDYYHVNGGTGIPGWAPSLLVPTLREGTLYRLKLTADKLGFETDTIPYFRSNNRYRDMAISPDGLKIFLITDSIGSTSGPSGTGTNSLSHRGAILVYRYTGAVLHHQVEEVPPVPDHARIKIYPNPVSQFVNIEIPRENGRNFRYEMVGLDGRVVLSGYSYSRSIQLNVGELKRGFYLLRLYNESGAVIALEKLALK